VLTDTPIAEKPQPPPTAAATGAPRLAALIAEAEVPALAPGASDAAEGDAPLYAASPKIYPQSVRGTFRRIKWAVLLVTLGIYYFLPFVRFDRGLNAPDQAVLVDLEHSRFYFFFIEIWPQEVYYITGLLIIAAVTLFLMNAIAGRIWCGYLCPQTVWTDLFLAVERLTEGDRRARMQLDRAPWTIAKLARKGAKHFLWLMIAWWTGGAWVLYFADAPSLVKSLALGTAPLIAYVWIGILTFTTYSLAGHMREQVCLYMCPWPRIQAALTDEDSLNVTYRYDRGEPRGSVKKAALARQQGLPAGDCVECLQCVHVCPTGVDIREGSNLGCIQCGLCIDACDAVMAKIGRPARLIAYDTDLNIKRRQEGKPIAFRPIRTRTLIYVGLIAAVGAIMLYTLIARSTVHLDIIHDRNPMFVKLSDGAIRNAYTVRVLNKKLDNRFFYLTMQGLSGAAIEIVGESSQSLVQPLIEVGPDQSRELRVLVTLRRPPPAASIDVTFTVKDELTGEDAQAQDHFFGPQ
jgi:cytochrome c oxidase accessory protein FixG